MITCSFCGNVFDENENTKSCSGCPMSKNCNKVKCPKCNFENTKPLNLKQIFIKKSPNNDPYKKTLLTDLKIGNKARIQSIDFGDSSHIRKLTILGIMPGETLTLVQRFPSFVIRVDNTQVAIDRDIASKIQVSLIT